MDLTTFGMAGVAAITVICYLAATAVKQTPLANKWLPTICGTLGGVLGVLAWCGSVPDFPAGDPLTALAVGIVSGLAATGTNQLIRQLKHTDRYVYQIAEDVGYPNLKYFYKVFKRTTGKSPNDYRSRKDEKGT